MSPHTAQLAQSSATVSVERRFELGDLPENWMALLGLLVVVGLCLWVLRTYRAEARRGSTLAVRMFLGALRCTVIVALAVIWLEPVLATYLHQHLESYTIVLVDASASMKIGDDYLAPEERRILQRFFAALGSGSVADEPVTRSDLTSLVLNGRDRAFIKELSRRNRLRIGAFSDGTVDLGTVPASRTEDGEPPDLRHVDLDVAFSGRLTDLGQTLRRMVDELQGAPIAAVVVISDGGFNAGESIPLLGRYAKLKNFPVYALGVGSPTPPRNVAVAELRAPPNAFIKDPLEITATVTAQGAAEQVITAELRARAGDSAEPAAVLERRTLTFTPENSRQALVFEYRPQRPGRYTLELHLEGGDRESITEDNDARVTVNVLDNKLRVLVVSSAPTWTYRFLSRLLERDDTFDLSCWLQSADRTAVRDGNTIIDRLPDNAADLFEYDLLLLLDPDPRPWPEGWAELVAEHVSRHGAGLMFCAGRKYTPLLFRDPVAAPLLRLLPISPDPEAELILNEIGYYQKTSSAIEFPQRAWEHPVLADIAGSQVPGGTPELWRRLGQVYWHYPVKHEKPAATVLMRHAHPRMRNSFGGHVLLALQYVGAGRSGFLGFDGTWRWRRFGEEVFNRFWVQSLRYLAEGRLVGIQPRGRIQTDRDNYEVGEPILFQARLTDGDYDPLREPDVRLELGGPAAPAGEPSITLHRDPHRDGWYAGQFIAGAPGSLGAAIRLSGSAPGEDVVISHQVSVRSSNLEILNPHMDRDGLRKLAQMSAGGEYYDLDQVFQIPQRIADRHETRISRAAPQPLWDTWWMLVFLVGLLGLEWSLRKKWQLL